MGKTERLRTDLFILLTCRFSFFLQAQSARSHTGVVSTTACPGLGETAERPRAAGCSEPSHPGNHEYDPGAVSQLGPT